MLETRGATRLLPEDAAAVVGERTIRRVDYERVLAGVEGDLRGPLDEALRRRVLERMIDEELLVQRALELGLAVIDRRVRGELTAGLIDSIVAETDAAEPDARDVERHFRSNVEFFTRPGRLRARTLFFSDHRRAEAEVRGHAPEAAASGTARDTPASAGDRAREAARRLAAGEDPRDVEAALADPQVSPVPDVLLPANKLRDYVGPSVLEAIEGLSTGQWSEPLPSPGGFHLALLVEREPAIVPDLAEVEALVRQDLKRRRGDEALRRYLDDLRGEIEVQVDESLFAVPDEG